MEKAVNSMNSSHPSIKKMNKKMLNKEISKTDVLVKLYKQLRAAIIKLENREVSFGEDYDEQFEDACNRRLAKLMQKHLRIHKYLIRKGIFVSDEGEIVLPDVKPKLIITSTGIEDLNVLLTEFVNQGTESEILGSKVRVPYQHVTVNDVRIMVEKLKETNKLELSRDDPLEFDQLIQNIACEVNKLVKKFIEDSHRVGLDDWTLTDQSHVHGCLPSTSGDVGATENKKDHSLSVPTWDAANIELHEACGRGELDCPEPKNSTDVDDTEMSPTTEELEEGEDCEDGVQDSDNNDMETKNSESEDSCGILEEQMSERSDRSHGDSDCYIIESDERVVSGGTANGDIEDNGADSLKDAGNPAENEEILNGDDDCCIIED